MNLPESNLLDEEFLVRANSTSDINQHLSAIKKLAEDCEHVTEVGVFIGNATVGLMAGRPKVLVGYELPRIAMSLKVQAAVKCIKELAKSEGIEYKYLLGDVHEITIEPTDFLFLDTNQQERTYDELVRHHGQVKKYIASHDTIYFPSQYEAFVRFLREFGNIWKLRAHYTNNNGLIVIERKENV